MTPPGAVVFDLDGTLIDTMTSVPTAYAETIRDLGGPVVSAADVVAAWHIGPTPAVLAAFLGRDTTAADIECFHRHLAAAVATVRTFPGVPAMLDLLTRHGYRLGLFTSATRRSTTLMLAAAGLDRRFASVICGDEVDAAKPAPDGLRLACRELAVDVADTVYVGDAEVDLRCAEAAGALAVHARWGRAVPVLDAPLVAHRPADLADLIRTACPAGPGHCQP